MTGDEITGSLAGNCLSCYHIYIPAWASTSIAVIIGALNPICNVPVLWSIVATLSSSLLFKSIDFYFRNLKSYHTYPDHGYRYKYWSNLQVLTSAGLNQNRDFNIYYAY